MNPSSSARSTAAVAISAPDRFRAFRLSRPDPAAAPVGAFVDLGVDDLSPGNVVIRVAHTSINYKDALAAAGLNQIIRQFPRIGGIDLSGHVAASADPRFAPGDPVVVHGFGLGVDHDGGHAEYARVSGDWVLPLPAGITLRDAAAIGVAGYTAALSLHWMEHNGLRPGGLPVVVTGATGGAASIAIDLLAGRGYEVVAITGKAEAHDYLKSLGAARVMAVPDPGSDRPLDKAQWGGAIDSVGGDLLAWLLRSVGPDATVASFGNAGGAALRTTVLPFILRGVRLLGINGNSPIALREQVWARLASDYKPRHLGRIVRDLPFEELPQAMRRMLDRSTQGRLVVTMRAGGDARSPAG